jgi:hypothetical protein
MCLLVILLLKHILVNSSVKGNDTYWMVHDVYLQLYKSRMQYYETENMSTDFHAT